MSQEHEDYDDDFASVRVDTPTDGNSLPIPSWQTVAITLLVIAAIAMAWFYFAILLPSTGC